MADSVGDEYRSSLADLNFNSKPHINVLTMLAEENSTYASKIVETIISHINSVPPSGKLPSLYLVDSIMKNVRGQYISLFSKQMVMLFTSVFSKVDEATRSSLYKLRQTWNEILPKNILYEVDCKVSNIDPAWPITAKPVPVTPKNVPTSMKTIHVNPKFYPNTPQVPAKSPTASSNSTVEKKPDPHTQSNLNEMLRQIEEKKLQLKVLEQKKLEMAAKQKKAKLNEQQKTVMNHLDPRLKRNIPEPQVASVKPFPLQSVVVAPKDSSNTISTIPDKSASSNSSVRTEVSVEPANKKLEPSDIPPPEIATVPANASKETSEIKETIKKRSLSPEHKPTTENGSGKKVCKSPSSKSKRLAAERECLQSTKEERSSKKGKRDFSKNRNKQGTHYNKSETATKKESQSADQPSRLFGNEDRDYRHQPQNNSITKSRQWRGRQGGRPPMNPRMSHVSFYPRPRHPGPYNDQNSQFRVHENRPVHSPISQLNDDSYHSPKNDFEGNKAEMDLDTLKKDANQTFKPILMRPDDAQNQTYKSNSMVAQPYLLPPQMHKTFRLDGKDRTIYFVNKRALTVLDNNEPRELFFIGNPTNVYIEGLPQPLLLTFDGKPVEFETEKKRNTIHFGTPLREIYINNFPYEAEFGGRTFTALLEDKKEHKVRIDGPPPQVIISEKPAFDLLEMHNQSRRLSPTPPPTEPSSNAAVSSDSAAIRDVDMRVKPSHLSSSVPDSIKDVDWRHTSGDGSQVPWSGSKESFESLKAMQGRNFAGGGPTPVMPRPQLQWDDPSKRIHSHGETGAPEARFPTHPGYRQMLSPEKPRFDAPLPRPPAPPIARWERPVAPLPPPPAIPPSLTTLNVPPVPNVPSTSTLPGTCGTTWNPLPPPPMFTGSIPDIKLSVAPAPLVAPIASTIAPSVSLPDISVPVVPSLPVNVETIFEQLVAAGIISKTTTPNQPEIVSEESVSMDVDASEEEDEAEIILVPKSLREYRPFVIAALYKGSQCATCGMRFKEIQSEQYSRHLDWHFRMNRREKDGAKKAYSRRLFYEIKDWIQFKEVEEAEERTPSYFELQADGESKNEVEEKILSVPASASESEKCAVCSDQFQLFWVEEEEEWHLKHAVQHDGEVYHPLCYEDFKKAEEQAKRAAEEEEKRLEEERVRAAEEAAKAEEEAAKAAEEEAARAAEELAKTAEEEAAKLEAEKAEKAAEEDTKIKEEVKEEPMEEDDDQKPTPEDLENAEIPIKEEVEVKTEEVVIKQEQPSPVKEEPVEQLMDIHSDAESEGEEFRPPTPDPRFDVQPPVFRSKEMSALCSIM